MLSLTNYSAKNIRVVTEKVVILNVCETDTVSYMFVTLLSRRIPLNYLPHSWTVRRFGVL